jgi:hypothetical protein
LFAEDILINLQNYSLNKYQKMKLPVSYQPANQFYRLGLLQIIPMKILLTILFAATGFFARSQTICGTAGEGGTVTITAPPGNYITGVQFASYGTPTGSCGSFAIGTCHAANSLSIVSAALIGFNSGSVSADNTVFGDPCGGTVKQLYIQATYSTTLPITLVSFTAEKINTDKVKLQWTGTNEINTSAFIVQRSTNGSVYDDVGSIASAGSGDNHYSFINATTGTQQNYFYRLKIVDQDGKFQYSNIVHLNFSGTREKLSVFPNPANDMITINSSRALPAHISNMSGVVVKSINLINGSQILNVKNLVPGVYFIRTTEEVIKFLKK